MGAALALVLSIGASLPGLVPPLAAQVTAPLTIQPSSGNVGIGTTQPTARLQVNNGGGPIEALWLQGGLGYNMIRFENGTGYTYGYVGFGSTGAYALRISSWDSGGSINFDTGGGTDRAVITADGRVGIGKSNPTTLLDVAGVITGTQKNFQIPHPLDPESKVLIHSSLEGPEVGVYYRGEAQLVTGQAEVLLPAYFEALTRKERRTVQLTPLDGWSPLYVIGGVQSGKFLVRTAAGGDPSQRFYWEVKATRADVAPVQVERVKPVEETPQAPRR
jgi:hypothetical protein